MAVGGVREAGHVVVVALLLEHVRLALPLPHQQLAQPAAPQRYPVTWRVECDAADTLVRYTEGGCKTDT